MSAKSALQGLVACILVCATAKGADPPEGTGEIRGTFVLKGEIPKLGPVPGLAGLAVCPQPIANEMLVVDPNTKRVANVFVWATKMDGKAISPTPPPAPALEIDNKACRFEPHCLIAHSGQTLVLLNADPVAHNVHTDPITPPAINDLIGPNNRVGVRKPVGSAQIVPIPVQCDIHPWMRAHMLILDHPYAALSDAKGTFTIEGLPPGKYDLKVWQEAGGYVIGAAGIKGVEVKAGEATDVGTTEIDVAKLKNLPK